MESDYIKSSRKKKEEQKNYEGLQKSCHEICFILNTWRAVPQSELQKEPSKNASSDIKGRAIF